MNKHIVINESSNEIIAMSFDIADQKCKTYNTYEWFKFLAETRNEHEVLSGPASEVIEAVHGDEFWYEMLTEPQYNICAVAFDLQTESFVTCYCEEDVEMVNAEGRDDEIFWND